MKSGEAGDAELLGAGVGAKTQRGEGFADRGGFGERPQVVDQRFALQGETQFHKIEEQFFRFRGWVWLRACGDSALGGAQREFCSFAGEAEGDEGGSDSGRRVEGAARNFENEFGAGIELREDREIAVVARAGLGGEAESDFGLDDDVNFVDEIGEVEEVMEDGRGDVVGEIAVDADAASGGEGREIGFEDVAGNDIEVGRFFRKVAKSGDELRVEFDGVDGCAGGEKVFGHFAVAGADFDPAVLIVAGEWRGGMRGDADGAGDLFAPVDAFQKMLPERLACHGGNSVAGPRRKVRRSERPDRVRMQKRQPKRQSCKD